MTVSDRAASAVRALLGRDWNVSRQLMRQLDDTELRQGYYPLLTATFLQSVHRRFSGRQPSEIALWVAEIRIRLDAPKELDPGIAERLLLWAFDQESIDDVEFRTNLNHQTILVLSLIEEAQFDSEQIDQLVEGARAELDSV